VNFEVVVHILLFCGVFSGFWYELYIGTMEWVEINSMLFVKLGSIFCEKVFVKWYGGGGEFFLMKWSKTVRIIQNCANVTKTNMDICELV